MPPVSNLESVYDCVIVGAGPAGLTCAIFLGRYRRRVLVIHNGKPRNYASHGVHGFLGQHGIEPRELLRRGTEEAESVGVEFMSATVRTIGKAGDVFEIQTDHGVAKGRRVGLAYGLKDRLPDIEGFDAYYGKSIFHCPDCDGYEVSDKVVGVIGTGKPAAGLSLKLLQWSSKIAIFTNGEEHGLSQEDMSKLLAESIRVDTTKIRRFDGSGECVEGLELETGERVAVEAMFFTLGVERNCLLAEDLGCDFVEDTPNLRVDDSKQTTVAGIYAMGDLVPGSQLAVTSAADGAIAAIAINKSLLPPGRLVS